jgi:O-antigen/teichoic acid export membrane protein
VGGSGIGHPRSTHLRFGHFSELAAKGHGARRSGLLRLAMIGSFFSKISGLALQAIAIPLVYHSLGQHRYELYLLLTAALATVGLAQLGAGPGLTQGIATANALGKRHDEGSLLAGAFRLTGVATLIGGGIVLSIIHLVPPERVFGSAFVNDRGTILTAANLCVIVLMAQMLFGVVDSALAGYQEQVFTSVGSMVANLLSIGVLFIVCRNAPTVTGVILVLYGVPTLSRIANLLALFFRRPYLLRGLLQSSRGFYATLMNVGLAFWAIQLGGVIEQHGGTYVLAHLSSTHDTDLFGVVYRALVLAGAVVNIITVPLWPAITDAIAHRDIDWIHRSYARVRRALTVYSCLLAFIVVIGGQWIFEHILRVDTGGNHWLFVILGFYFVANIWTHLFYVTMMGLQGIWRIAAVLCTENLLMLGFGLVLVPRLGAAGMALAYLSASVALPVWLLPRLMERALHKMAVAPQIAEHSLT